MKKILKSFSLSLLFLGILQSNVTAGEKEQFIERLYQNILNRTADSGGMSTWLNTIQTESAAKVALGFLNSQEFINKNLSNEEFVDILYTTLFDRQADFGGRTNWLNKLNNNISTKNEVMYGFFNAQEFKNLADRFGVTQIRPEDQLNAGTSGVNGYVNRFYSLVLNRNADASGFNDWTTQLNNQTKAGGDIAKGFFNSQEYINRNLNNSEFLDIAYRAFFNREADTGGKANWTTKLNQGSSKDTVLDGFIGSQEFIALVASYGIKNKLVVLTDNKFTQAYLDQVTLYQVKDGIIKTHQFRKGTWLFDDTGRALDNPTKNEGTYSIDAKGALAIIDVDGNFGMAITSVTDDYITIIGSGTFAGYTTNFYTNKAKAEAKLARSIVSFVSGKKIVINNDGEFAVSFHTDGTYEEDEENDGINESRLKSKWLDNGDSTLSTGSNQPAIFSFKSLSIGSVVHLSSDDGGEEDATIVSVTVIK